MNFYTVAIEGMPKMLLEIDQPMASFKRDQYGPAFKKYYEKNLVVLEAIENGYKTVLDKEQFLENMAQALAGAAEERLNKIGKKNKREAQLLDFNVCLAVYILPAVLEYHGESTEDLKDHILKAWKEKFPKTNVQASTFDNINKGFKRKFCYITTAVCETFKKPDNCYELTVLREYRDTYLLSQEDGENIVQEYYNLAPTIVKHINRKKNRKEIYEGIWEAYLSPCIRMIENGENEKCKELYIKMVRDLQKAYFIEPMRTTA